MLRYFLTLNRSNRKKYILQSYNLNLQAPFFCIEILKSRHTLSISKKTVCLNNQQHEIYTSLSKAYKAGN
ncbi:MAG: hypothetical protein K0Q57_412 [Gammaproteobacteria bacterium]|jgi:hypothetical protein|nr:hypothetical protein [Gammaproteobacteria bacterium]